MTDNTWHHVAAVRDTQTDKLYIYLDGNSDATPVADTTLTTLATNEPFGVGHRVSTMPSGDKYFGGLIDDVRIYNHALSQAEIQEIIPEPGTVLLLGLGGIILRKKR